MRRALVAVVAAGMVAVGCGAEDRGAATPVGAATAPASTVRVVDEPLPTPSFTPAGEPSPLVAERVVDPRHLRPAWLGTRPLTDELGARVTGQVTPPELVDRQLMTVDRLPPPAEDVFEATIAPLSDELVARSTLHDGCPVTREDLAHLVVTHWGFDGLVHTGELIVHADEAEGIAQVFAVAFDARFPIEQLGIASMADLEERLPTGDGNGSGAFVCRNTVGSGRWSQHAYGLAVDLNPFHNPYVRGDWVLPELAASYLDRTNMRPGMLHEGHPVVRAFDAIGWRWGGRWSTAKDWMHFSRNGR